MPTSPWSPGSVHGGAEFGAGGLQIVLRVTRAVNLGGRPFASGVPRVSWPDAVAGGEQEVTDSGGPWLPFGELHG